jgi:hypothetical protein
MTKTFNNADSVRKPTWYERYVRWLETRVESGELTKKGQQRWKMCLEAGLHIDPKTAEVKYEFMPYHDPYGLLQVKYSDVPRHYFARSPGSDIWVSWHDLPEEVEGQLWRKHKKTDPALRNPTSCWASFYHSKYFRKDVPDLLNYINFVATTAFGEPPGQ